ncbi:MAG: chloride channel protein [Pseudobdellovibrio sp.]
MFLIYGPRVRAPLAHGYTNQQNNLRILFPFSLTLVYHNFCYMQTTQHAPRNPYFNIPISLFLGLVIGALTLLFIYTLSAIDSYQGELNAAVPYHLALIPLVIVLINLAKRNTLYFPFKVADLRGEVSSHFWSPIMAPLHFIGTCLSHLSGVSVGREGAAVMFSAGIVRLFRMSWLYWGPIATTIGFSAVVGQYWVAPFFISEMFDRSTLLQKIYAFMGSIVAVLLIQSFKPESLFHAVSFTTDMGFFKKLVFFFLFAACAGLIIRVYKKLYKVFSDYFKKSSMWFKVFVAFLLAVFLFTPEFRKFQSLGILQITNLELLQSSFLDVAAKLFLTLISTSLGFMGGEFIPLIYAGVHFGHSFFNSFGYSAVLGSGLAAYLFFAAGTRFKWTSYILLLGLMGFGWWFWGYFVISTAISFSGPLSLYKKETVN